MQPLTGGDEKLDHEARAGADVSARTQLLAVFSAVLIGCALLIQVWARSFLYADGAFYVFWVVDTGAPIDFDPPRRFAQWITEYPLALASSLTSWQFPALAHLYGLSALFAPYFLSICACAYALRRRPLLIIFPLASIAAAGLNSSLFIVSESHFLAALFWPLFCFLVEDRRPTWLSWGLIFTCAIPTLRSYETMALLGLFLGALSGLRALQARDRLADRVAFLTLSAWFVAGAAIGIYWIVNPRVPENRAAFMSSLVSSVYEAGHLNLSLVGSAVAMVLMLLPLLTDTPSRPPYLPICAFVMLGLTVGALTFDPSTFYPLFHYRARVLNSVVPAALATAFLLARWRYTQMEGTAWYRSASVLTMLAVAQVLISILIASDWHHYAEALRGDLAGQSGLIPYNEAGVSKSAELAKWNFDWTMPTLSLLLAPHGKVNALIATPTRWTGWVPFDPKNSKELPRLERQGVDWSIYRDALEAAKS